MGKFLILHGVNLNMFGRRDPGVYGTATLADINGELEILAAGLDADIAIFQTNHEGEMVERIHRACDEAFDGVLINAGAWTHCSYAIADALAILRCPIVEVHMSNIHAREAFRAHSVFSGIVRGSIAGFGPLSYALGLRALVEMSGKS